MPKEQIKSRERVAAHGEVFTSEREVNAMLDLVRPFHDRERKFHYPEAFEEGYLSV